MKTEFTKYQVAGGDWLIIPAQGIGSKHFSSIAQKLCDRHTGAGADGAAFVTTSTKHDADIYIFRPDGSHGEMSLSAVLCASRLISDKMSAGKTDLTVSAGRASVRVIISRSAENPLAATVTADAGKVSFLPDEIPLSVKTPVIDRLTEVGNRIFRITALSCCFSPWAVSYTLDLQNCNTAQYGALLSNHALFPQKCSAVFAQEIDTPDCISVEAYVRGSGIPLSEGSAALAAVCAGVRLGRLSAERKIRIKNDVGELTAFCGSDGTAMLSAEVVEVFRGEVTL